MMEKNRRDKSYKGYTGIDCFRLIAALLVVAIHTSPLASCSETGDFIFTRIIARVAVPFFFMTSGFFLISRYTRDAKPLGAFVKKTAMIYGAAVILYIPVNIYNGYFKMDNLLPELIKDLVFDGTLYHLWYLPASMLGAAIAWYLVKRLDYPKAAAAAAVLYLVGLFGDSYYGIAKEVPCLKGFYGLIFQVSDYTRNGIFFAPVFFIMGGLIADKRSRPALGKSILGFLASFALMWGEGLALHHFHLQRHDSMYVFLLPCMYFLFQTLLHFRGRRLLRLRTLSLLLYILHPMVILGIRLAAKLLHLQYPLVENSLLHYFLVCVISAASGMAAAGLWNKFKPKRARHRSDTDRAFIELDRSNLEHNVRVLKKAMPPKCGLMAVVKAEGYGHGAFEISTQLEKNGVRAFAVATIDEGIRLRKYGIRGEILILGYTDVHRAYELKKYDLIQTVIDYDYGNKLDQQGVRVKAHIKIDTGMHRLGIPVEEVSKVKEVFGMRNIKVCGIFTHLCCPDSPDAGDAVFTREQIHKFYDLADALKSSGIVLPKLHIQSSYGLFNYPELLCDYVRVGIALYGVLSTTDENLRTKPELCPVLSLKARVVLIRAVSKGESVGYGRSFTADRECRIAILPIGYGDGVPRSLSNGKSGAMIRGQYAPIVGRICMDQLAVDITDIENVSVGDTATLIDREKGSGLYAPVVAGNSDTISNELLCRLGARLPVVVAK